MNNTRVFLRKIRMWLDRKIEITKYFPYLRPRISQILFATSSGIFLSFGTSLVLGIVDNQGTGWRSRHWIGILCILSSIIWSLLAWFAQGFLEYLVDRGKDQSSMLDRADQFKAWNLHYVMIGLSLANLAIFLAIVTLLIGSA